jgi:sugar fermentation stimulation protein A
VFTAIFLFILIGFYRTIGLCEKGREQQMTIPVMKIHWDTKATFRSRPNRFLGIVDITSPKKNRKKKEKVHVHDPGRLNELLYPGNKVLLRKTSNPNRKTKWDLIAAMYDDQWVLVHSGFHREIAEWVIGNEKVSPFKKVKDIKPEVKFGKSRLDFLLTKKNGKKIWVEVKGCTLAVDDVALFPDAPTIRGSRHVRHLIEAKEKGDEAAIIILVFRQDARCFAPHAETDPDFSKAFYSAFEVGVEVHPLKFSYKDGVVNYIGEIPVCESF